MDSGRRCAALVVILPWVDRSKLLEMSLVCVCVIVCVSKLYVCMYMYIHMCDGVCVYVCVPHVYISGNFEDDNMRQFWQATSEQLHSCGLKPNSQ